MCGIAGTVTPGAKADPALVAAMRDKMRHRGPDSEGLWVSADGSVCLGHRRLAVIDLSERARQPMLDASGRIALVFNGEIYNHRQLRSCLMGLGHRFSSTSDTETIIKAYLEWGKEFVHHLDGMFAFALYDSARRSLLLLRDRAGEKPLFYRATSGLLAFASELKSLMQDAGSPNEMDPQAFLYFLAYGYVPDSRCILSGVRKLPAGCLLLYEIAHGKVSIERYWELPTAGGASPRPADELEEEFQNLLTKSISNRLVADVPVGIMLSGGLDSALVTAVAAGLSPHPVRTFNVAFPGNGEYDESPHARLIASAFGTLHTEFVAEPVSIELLTRLAHQFDEPMADSSLVPTFLICQLIRQVATVALGGDGGDELFGGYGHYSWLQRQDDIARRLPGPFLSAVGHIGERLFPVGVRGRNPVVSMAAGQSERVARRNLFLGALQRNRLLSARFRDVFDEFPQPEEEMVQTMPQGLSILQLATAFDFNTYLVDDLLVKIDRASMLTSLEVRSPFLDHKLIEFAFGRVPDQHRATRTDRKILPKSLARRILPDSFDFTRKRGFSVPLTAWFKSGLWNHIEAILDDCDSDLFDRKAMQDLMARRNRPGVAERLLGLAMFELWRRDYNVKTPF